MASKFNLSAKEWTPGGSFAPTPAPPAAAPAYPGGQGVDPSAAAAPDLAAMMAMLGAMNLGAPGATDAAPPAMDMTQLLQLAAAMGGGAMPGMDAGVAAPDYGGYGESGAGEGGGDDLTAEDEANLLAWEQEQMLAELEHTLDGMGVVDHAERQQLILSYLGESGSGSGGVSGGYTGEPDEVEDYDEEEGVAWTPDMLAGLAAKGRDLKSDGGGWGALLAGDVSGSASGGVSHRTSASVWAPPPAPAPAPVVPRTSLSVHAAPFVPGSYSSAPAPAPVQQGAWGKPAPAPAPAKKAGGGGGWGDL